MKVGNLSGLGSVYDEKGNPILLEGEALIREVPEDNILVIEGKGRLRSKTLLNSTKEKGTVYLTDRRFIFLRKPDPKLKFRTYGNPFTLATAHSEAAYARDLLKAGGMEYLEIYYTEVKSFKTKKSKYTDLHLESEAGTLVRVLLDRRDRGDDKLVIMEKMLIEAGAQKSG